MKKKTKTRLDGISLKFKQSGWTSFLLNTIISNCLKKAIINNCDSTRNVFYISIMNKCN